MDNRSRFDHLSLLVDQYPVFSDFAADGMAFLGFTLTEMQADIAEFMQDGPRLRMVMAQRGEAKTTLAALYAIWRIIHRPSTRVLIVSAGEQNSSDTAILIVRLIMTWDILECLRPDKAAGDRTSTTAFDVHYALKGLDRSPSIACAGVGSNLPGRRADLLIPDDIESNKNGLTVVQRQQLLQLSKEFSSICTHGDILYLGTPQSKDSIYNTLDNRGFCLRIWPGRYPTQDEVEKYGDRLAPYLSSRIAADPTLQRGGGIDGSRGKPSDTGRYTEEDLVEKELDKGPEDFQLQYMLDTSLADELRLQLKLSDLMVANFDSNLLPEIMIHQPNLLNLVDLPRDFVIPGTKMYHPLTANSRFVPPKEIFMYIDPAGGGSDELAFAASCSIGPYIHVLDVGGLKGGLAGDNPAVLCEIIKELGVQHIMVESNMGHGLFEINLRAELAKVREDKDGNMYCLSGVGVEGEYSTGQKEKRIIDSLVSPMQRHRIVLHKRVFESDIRFNKQHNIDSRQQYSLFYQLANITSDRNSLVKDDRVEAMAGAVRHFKGILAVDENKAAAARVTAELIAHMANPMGYNLPKVKASGTRRIAHTRRSRK